MSSVEAGEAMTFGRGRYRVVARLATGGMANVYLVIGRGVAGFQKLAVIKELKPMLADDAPNVEMFYSEARLAARLSHPNVVQTNEVSSDSVHPFMVLEFLDGQPLHKVMARFLAEGEKVYDVAARVLVDALAGLHYAHDLADFDGTPLGLVHRDVSPQNIFVTYSGLVKVVDFGVAKVDGSPETQAGTVKGKFAYMSPEQTRGDRVDRRADVFSAGITLWEALAGRRIADGVADAQLILSRIKGEVPSIDEAAPRTPASLRAICTKATSARPHDRYATAEELRDDLARYLATERRAPTLVEIGQHAAEAFAGERERRNGLLDEAIRSERETSDTAQLFDAPRITLPSFPSMGGGSLRPVSDSIPPPLVGTAAAAAARDTTAHTSRETRGAGLVAALLVAAFIGGASAFAVGRDASGPAPAADPLASSPTAAPVAAARAPEPDVPAPTATIAVAQRPPRAATGLTRTMLTASTPGDPTRFATDRTNRRGAALDAGSAIAMPAQVPPPTASARFSIDGRTIVTEL